MKMFQNRIEGFVIALLLLFAFAARAKDSFPAEKLIDIARRHHLPMPPAAARLVMAHTESWSMVGKESTSRDPAIYSPAFLLEERSNGIVRILRGTEEEQLDHQHDTQPRWRPFSDKTMKPVLGGHINEFSRISAFVCAVQLAARGEDSQAERIWHRVDASEWLSDAAPHENVRQDLRNPQLLLAKAIYRHLKNRVLESPGEWPQIHDRIRALLEEFPSLKADPRFSAVAQGLAAALEAKPAPTHSTEALLVEWSRLPRDRKDPNRMLERSSDQGPKGRIILRGADAVPGLIRLVNDKRITTHEVPAFMNAPSRVRLLGELAQELLEEITGIKGKSPWEHADISEFRAWLEKCRQGGEEQAFIRGVFAREQGRITAVNDAPARILAQKWPQSLAALCEEFSRDAKPEAQPFGLAEAVAASQLSKERKVGVLADFARRGSLEHKRPVLRCLAPLDPQTCSEILIPIIQNLPADPVGPYWTCPEAALTHCVMLLENDNVWRAYLRAARRSSVGLRMEMMDSMGCSCIGQTNRSRRLAFLAAFLHDENVREIPKHAETSKFSGPCAAFTIKRIAVRDFAANKIACILRLSNHADEFWTPAQWTALGEKVERGLAEEKLPAL